MKNLKDFLNAIDNKILVTIFPHPDDETIPTGGLLLEAKNLGWTTISICLTKGDAGNIHITSAEPIAKIREKEFMRATKTLRLSKTYLLSYKDAQLRKSEKVITQELTKLILKLRPGVIVTYDHSGATGHPDHILGSVIVSNIVKNHALSSRLLWVSFTGIPRVFNKNSPTFSYFSNPNFSLNLSFSNRFKKVKAYLAHQSQIPNLKVRMLFSLYCLFIPETYHLVDRNKTYEYKYVDFKI